MNLTNVKANTIENATVINSLALVSITDSVCTDTVSPEFNNCTGDYNVSGDGSAPSANALLNQPIDTWLTVDNEINATGIAALTGISSTGGNVIEWNWDDAATEQVTIPVTKPIASISVDGEIIDFTAYTGDLAALNPNVVFSVSDESAIEPYLTTLWSTGETTQSIEVTPTETGPLTRSVTVDDGVDTATDTETVTVLNELPTLVLTANDEEARAGQEVTFTAASNVDVTFSSTDVVLVGTGNTRTAIMPVLPISSTVTVIATATNLDGVSATESIEITVDAQIVANAGADQAVITGDIVTVIGGYAGDALNIPLVYTWRIVNDPTGEIVLGAPNGSQASFTTNGVGLGDVILGLTIGDGFADSEEDLISVSINDTPNLAPTADAGDNQTGIYAGAEFQLRAIAIDGDGVISGYEWTQVSGDAVTLSDASIINPVGIAPISSTPQTLVFEVVAIDERGGRSAPSQVSVGVNAATSTAVVTITGLSDGDYFIKLISDVDDSKIFSGIATFENNEARVITTALSGTPYFGRFLGTPPEDGTGLYGVTE